MKQNIVLLHGLFGGLSNWTHLIRHFEPDYNIHTPALPIYDEHSGDNLDYLVAALENYIEAQQLTGIILAGNSLGGHIAILYTSRNQQKVSRLILTGSSGLYENSGIGSYPRRGNYEYIRERVAYTFYDPAIATPELVAEVFSITNNFRKAYRILKTAKSANRNYVAPLLPGIKVRTLLIWGEDDKIAPKDVAIEFLRLLPNAELAFLSECGHAPMMERPKEFNELMESFLAR